MIYPLQVPVPGGIEMLVILFIAAIWFVVPLVVSALIYRGAKARNSRHALAWAIGGFFGGLVVWILYLVVRDEIGPGGPPARGGR